MLCVESDSISTNSFDSLPDVLVLVILDQITEVRTLGCCAAVSRRLNFLVRHVNNVLIKLDSEPQALISHPCGSILFEKSNKRVESCSADHDSNVTHPYSPVQVLKNFNDIKILRIHFHRPELELDSSVLLKWSATFGSTLNNFVILAATSLLPSDCSDVTTIVHDTTDTSIIPESFYASGDLKSRVMWTMSSLVAASARHYSLNPIIAEHKKLEKITMDDASGQGVLRIGKKQLEEMRKIQQPISCSTNRTAMPDLEMKFWYARQLKLADGSVLVGATLGVIQPRGKAASKEFVDGDIITDAFAEPFVSAAKVLVKGRCYSVCMDAF